MRETSLARFIHNNKEEKNKPDLNAKCKTKTQNQQHNTAEKCLFVRVYK